MKKYLILLVLMLLATNVAAKKDSVINPNKTVFYCRTINLSEIPMLENSPEKYRRMKRQHILVERDGDYIVLKVGADLNKPKVYSIALLEWGDTVFFNNPAIGDNGERDVAITYSFQFGDEDIGDYYLVEHGVLTINTLWNKLLNGLEFYDFSRRETLFYSCQNSTVYFNKEILHQ